MQNIKVSNKDEIIMKILHYFVTKENYKPMIIRGVTNEIWLENLDNNLKIIRINTGYLHNTEQLAFDVRKAKSIMKNIKRKTLSFKMNMLNIIVDSGENVKNIEEKDVETIRISKISDLKRNKFVKSFFPNISEINSKKMSAIELFALTDEINEKNYKEEKKVMKLFKNKKPYVTYTLMFINILIFILMLHPKIYNFMINNFANYYFFIKNGEVYRLITSGFLHANIIHIFFNMYALSVVGPEAERYYGKIKYLLIYFISMIIGNLFASVFTASAGVGASGAIFGLFGSLLFFSYNYRATLDGLLRSPVMPTIFVNLIISFIIPNVSASAHIGGLVGGFLSSMAVGIETKKNKSNMINALISILIMICFLGYVIYTK